MAGDLPSAQAVRRGNGGEVPHDVVVLAYDERLLRRRRLVTVHGDGFLVDLAETVGVDERDCFVLTDGRLIEVIAAEENLMEVQGDLHRYAWHIGNRHAPCQIEQDRLLIRRDHVLRKMLEGLGAVVKDVSEPFTPEGGAYGMGRTMGHSHGPEGAQGHRHDHRDGHDHDHDMNLLAGLGRDAG
jgi:urease accessory protein